MEWRLFADLADITGTREVSQSVSESGSFTVADAIGVLVDEYPGLAGHLFDESDELYGHINILKNGQDISSLEGLETPVSDDDELAVFPPVSGG